MLIGDIGELGFLERISSRFSKDSDDVIISFGDDAAVIEPKKDKYIAMTTDMLIEGVHFDLSFMSPFDLGRKAILVNVSDIAAMAGNPAYALVSLGLTKGCDLEFLNQLYDGLFTAAKEYDLKILGGDTVSSPGAITINVTLIGTVEPALLTRRSGAKVGDAILVTGTLGNSAAGLFALKNRLDSPKEMILRHIKPTPRVKEATVAASVGINALEDISDGLASEINHISKESGVGAILFEDLLPISENLKRFSKENNQNVIDFALYGGEDYELVFTASSDLADEIIEDIKAKTKTDVNVIGEIVESAEGVNLITVKGEKFPIKFGYDHFKK
ncbi:MAG: thiamine-phosphate kinase [Actinomycetota bacterium]|nr:thiamine-phosphate kinase [Actinomycetota bacterium]